jgi:hypothetical protein
MEGHYYSLDPEVAGGWGAQTVADTAVHPPRVEKLHYVFDGWLGDDLVQSFPCFLVTDALAQSIRLANLTGYSIAPVLADTSPEFQEGHRHTQLPLFHWFRVAGSNGATDFSLSRQHLLVVSERALGVLRQHNISHCTIEPVER